MFIRVYFNIFLYLKKLNRIKISNVSELEFNVFSEKGAYSLKNTDYSKEEVELLKRLRKINFIINKNDLRGFLLKFKEIPIHLKLDSIEYDRQDTYKKLPLKFTLKIDNDKISTKMAFFDEFCQMLQKEPEIHIDFFHIKMLECSNDSHLWFSSQI